MVRHRFRGVEVLQALHPEPRLEPPEGKVYEMTPPSSEDAGLPDWPLSSLAPRVTGRAQLRVQSPLCLSEAWDREKKLPLHAEAGVPEVWPLTQGGLEVHGRPEGRAYGESFVARGERVAPLLPQAELPYHPPL